MGHFYLLAALAAIVSIITLASFHEVPAVCILQQVRPGIMKQTSKEVPLPMLFSMIILAVICLLLSLLAIPGRT
ncbi:MAG: hypothetical protein MZV63_34650 [Marinilabiliales bacterium]|nr:hypothetical protein [Marinilabiliales bacterium]